MLITAVAAYRMNVRLYRTSEGGLAALRIKRVPARPRPVHAAPSSAERRGALVWRVTSDIDQISRFIQYGGLMISSPAAQLVVARA